MAGRRLLDVAALLNASRGIAQRHVALRQQQLDVFLRSSSLAKAVKTQAERYTETAKAASILAARMNEDRPAWTYEATDTPPQQTKETVVPSPEATATEPAPKIPREGLEQDHFYEPSKANGAAEPLPKDELPINGAKPDAVPTPDGSIPPTDTKAGIPLKHHHASHEYKLSSTEARTLQREYENQIPSKAADGEEGHKGDSIVKGMDDDSFYHPSEHISPTLSSLPRVKLPKHTNAEQGDDVHVANKDIHPDTYTAPTTSKKVAGEETLPEGINTAIFHSRRVAQSLGGRIITDAFQDGTQRETKPHPLAPKPHPLAPKPAKSEPIVENPAAESTIPVPEFEPTPATVDATPSVPVSEVLSPLPPKVTYEMRESRVPSTRLGRIWNYGGLAAGMFGGAVTESLRRATGSGGQGSFMLSAANMDRLVAKLSRMRGAALKMGQMMSFQDSKMLPAPIQEVLMRVQDCADYMPASQRNKVLAANLGADWRDLFDRFDEKPIAAASIGQVHSATLKSTGERVAVKVQYPGVADSIDSDLNNLAILLTASKMLPKGLFLEKTIANARTELAWECDYEREAECGKRFEQLLADEQDVFVVPKVIPEASGKTVITMEFMDGVGVTKVQDLTQEQRNWIGTNILRLCLREITEFRFMQTDPNWTNFLFNAETNKLELLDFGASREYPEEFIAQYTQLLNAASKSDKEAVRALSLDLGYLTGHESEAMVAAHTSSVLTLAEPFLASSPKVYDFQDQTITERVKSLIPVMLKERLAPPPEETYSLHRKLSGAFLLCARLGSQVRCRELFEDSMKKAGYA